MKLGHFPCKRHAKTNSKQNHAQTHDKPSIMQRHLFSKLMQRRKYHLNIMDKQNKDLSNPSPCSRRAHAKQFLPKTSWKRKK